MLRKKSLAARRGVAWAQVSSRCSHLVSWSSPQIFMPPGVRRQLSDPNRGYNYQSLAQPGEPGVAAGPSDACTWAGGISLQVDGRGGRCDKLVSSAGTSATFGMTFFPPHGHGSTVLCGWPELQVVAALRAARPVVEVGPLVAAADDRGGSVGGGHD